MSSSTAKQLAIGLAVVTLVPLLLLGLRVALNVSGFCFREVRFLSEDEIISRVIEDIYSSYPPAYYQIGVPVRNAVTYSSREEFVRSNSDCCVIVPSAYVDSSESDFRVPTEYSLFGKNRALVRVIYRVEWDPPGSGSSKAMPPGVMRDYRRVTNCGFVTNLW